MTTPRQVQIRGTVGAAVGWVFLVFGTVSPAWFSMYGGQYYEGIFHCTGKGGCEPWQTDLQASMIICVSIVTLSHLNMITYLLYELMPSQPEVSGAAFVSGGAIAPTTMAFFFYYSDGDFGYAPILYTVGGVFAMIFGLYMTHCEPARVIFQRKLMKKSYYKVRVNIDLTGTPDANETQSGIDNVEDAKCVPTVKETNTPNVSNKLNLSNAASTSHSSKPSHTARTPLTSISNA